LDNDRETMLVDHHCHLDFPELNADLPGVLARAKAAGVGMMVTIGTRVRRFGEVLAIAEAHDNIFCSVGTHPHYAGEERDVPLDDIVRLAGHRRVVAIGEAGLDHHYDKSPRADQAAGFRRHIEAARRTGLPLVIHTREADADTAAILEEEMAIGPFKAVLHCFTGGMDLARRGVALGLYVSFSGVITFNRADDLRAIAAALPLDRLLVETDAPYLAPMPFRGKRNEPAHVVHTAAMLAKVRGVTAETIAVATTGNFFRLYDRVPRPG
jgi:TatD DNase family protein